MKIVRISISIVVLLMFLAHARIQSQTSALASLAASLQPNNWVELPSVGLNTAMSSADVGGGTDGNIINYSDNAAWDPVSRRILYIGGDHNWSVPYTTKFVSYSESTNAWTTMPTPSWAEVMHGYHHTAFDAVTGILYHRPYNSDMVHRWSNSTWDAGGALPTFGQFETWVNCCDAVEYFPELNGLTWTKADGKIWIWHPGDAAWSTLVSGLTTGGTWQTAAYNPVRHEISFITQGFYRLSSAGTVATLPNPSINIYDGTAQNGTFTADPVSGKYIALAASSHQMYIYDPVAGTWTPQSSPTQPDLSGISVIAARIDTYGVILYASCYINDCHTYLYKPNGGAPPPPDTEPPTVTMTAPPNGSTISGTISVSATASDNVGVTGVQFKLDGANLGTEDTGAPYSISWNTTSTSNGLHGLTAVARDASGNMTTSSVTDVTVNNVAQNPCQVTPLTASVQQWPTTTSGSKTFKYTTSQAISPTGGFVFSVTSSSTQVTFTDYRGCQLTVVK